MVGVRLIVGLSAMLGMILFGNGFGVSARAAEAGFSGYKFSCLDYTNGLGANSTTRIQVFLARTWLHGFMSGFYKAQDMLDLSGTQDDAAVIDELFVQNCKQFPTASIRLVAMSVLAEPRKLPGAAGIDFAPATYTCGQHVDAQKGAASDINRADLVEMWAFAFVQGYRSESTPDLEIPPESKSAIIRAVNNSCASDSNRAMPYMNLVALVAERVKVN